MTASVIRLATRREATASIPDQLREIAEDIEAGALIGASAAVVIVDAPNDDLRVFGISPGNEQMRLNAAYMLLALARRELEQVALNIRE